MQIFEEKGNYKFDREITKGDIEFLKGAVKAAEGQFEARTANLKALRKDTEVKVQEIKDEIKTEDTPKVEEVAPAPVKKMDAPVHQLGNTEQPVFEKTTEVAPKASPKKSTKKTTSKKK